MRRRRYALGRSFSSCSRRCYPPAAARTVACATAACTATAAWARARVRGTFGAVNGNYAYTVEDVDRVPGAPLTVDVEVTITIGELRVSLEDAEGDEIVAMARPDQPARIEGVAGADNQGPPLAAAVGARGARWRRAWRSASIGSCNRHTEDSLRGIADLTGPRHRVTLV